MDTPQEREPGWRPFARLIFKIALLVALLAALHFGGRWAVNAVEAAFMPLYQAYGAWAMGIVVAVYIVLMSLPFMPGIEIGFALLMIFGAEKVPVVYGSTLAALTLSFLVGRLIPMGLISRLLGWLHLGRGRALLERLEPLPPADKLNLLVEIAPVRLIPFLLRHRYLAVAVAFNLPGNFIIGGGGGIAMVAGMSGLFRFPWYVLMVALAISPIPLAIVIFENFIPGGWEALRTWW